MSCYSNNIFGKYIIVFSQWIYIINIVDNKYIQLIRILYIYIVFIQRPVLAKRNTVNDRRSENRTNYRDNETTTDYNTQPRQYHTRCNCCARLHRAHCCCVWIFVDDDNVPVSTTLNRHRAPRSGAIRLLCRNVTTAGNQPRETWSWQFFFSAARIVSNTDAAAWAYVIQR